MTSWFGRKRSRDKAPKVDLCEFDRRLRRIVLEVLDEKLLDEAHRRPPVPAPPRLEGRLAEQVRSAPPSPPDLSGLVSGAVTAMGKAIGQKRLATYGGAIPHLRRELAGVNAVLEAAGVTQGEPLTEYGLMALKLQVAVMGLIEPRDAPAAMAEIVGMLDHLGRALGEAAEAADPERLEEMSRSLAEAEGANASPLAAAEGGGVGVEPSSALRRSPEQVREEEQLLPRAEEGQAPAIDPARGRPGPYDLDAIESQIRDVLAVEGPEAAAPALPLRRRQAA
jgi:hypothetical protein